jgi:hypothetical protein
MCAAMLFINYGCGCAGNGWLSAAREVAAAFRERKTKKEAAPTNTVPMTAIRLKMPAFRLRAMAESDLPKQAAQARRLEGETSQASTAADRSILIRFINS